MTKDGREAIDLHELPSHFSTRIATLSRHWPIPDL